MKFCFPPDVKYCLQSPTVKSSTDKADAGSLYLMITHSVTVWIYNGAAWMVLKTSSWNFGHCSVHIIIISLLTSNKQSQSDTIPGNCLICIFGSMILIPFLKYLELKGFSFFLVMLLISRKVKRSWLFEERNFALFLDTIFRKPWMG